MPATDDEIREKYLERAIREINSLTRDLQACHHCPRGSLMPVLGSGHPQADVFLLKYAPPPAEIEEGVAFYGRAGTALMKSLKRLGIDPLAVYGTLCVKCPVGDASLADPACIARVIEEIAIVQPKIVVVMGEDALPRSTTSTCRSPSAVDLEPGSRPAADAVDRRARHAEHRRVARRGGRQARLLVGLPRARRLVRGPAALLAVLGAALSPTSSSRPRSPALRRRALGARRVRSAAGLLAVGDRRGLVAGAGTSRSALRPGARGRRAARRRCSTSTMRAPAVDDRPEAVACVGLGAALRGRLRLAPRWRSRCRCSSRSSTSFGAAAAAAAVSLRRRRGAATRSRSSCPTGAPAAAARVSRDLDLVFLGRLRRLRQAPRPARARRRARDAHRRCLVAVASEGAARFRAADGGTDRGGLPDPQRRPRRLACSRRAPRRV